MFTRSAQLYDTLHASKDYAGEAGRLRRFIAAHSTGAAATLLEVACGTGRYLELLRPDIAVAGLDLDPAMLALARRRLSGVPLYQGDLADFDLERQFDVVVCLFGSIAYVRTVERLQQALATLARHTRAGGLIVIEPWLGPEQALDGHVGARFVDQPDYKIARMRVSRVSGSISQLEFHYLVATPDGVEHFSERHELGIFSQADYQTAFASAGVSAWHDPWGLGGWGLYVAVKG